MKTYGLIRPDSVPSSIELLLDVPDIDNPNSRNVFYKDDFYFVVYGASHDKDPTDLVEDQLELPLSSLPWVVDSIENGFWRKPSEGGLPKNKHGVNSFFNDEEILIHERRNGQARV